MKRQDIDQLLAQAKSERQRFEPVWGDLGDYLLPGSRIFLGQSSPTDARLREGDRLDEKVLDTTATEAVEGTAAGLMSNSTSPARPWFSLAVSDPRVRDLETVKRWLSDCTDRLREAFIKSNIYNALHQAYIDLPVYGTACITVDEDERSGIIARVHPIGTYWLLTNARRQVDGFLRHFPMTARQMVQEFGDRVPGAVKVAAKNPATSLQPFTVGHAILPSADYEAGNPFRKRWASCYWCDGHQDPQFLREGGYDEFPVLAPRWSVLGESAYGRGPGWKVLGHVKALQSMWRRKHMADEQVINPALLIPSSHQGAVSRLPGAENYLDNPEQVRPLHNVPFDSQRCIEVIQDLRSAINSGLYRSLFMMLEADKRSGMTAREIDERAQEKMTALGPMLERLNFELYAPLIDRAWGILWRRGYFDAPPEIIQGTDLRVEYMSTMARAQKMTDLRSMDNFISYAMQVAQAKPDVLDKIDFDRSLEERADMLGIPPRILRSDAVVAQERDQRAQQQAAQQQAMQDAQQAQTLKNLAGARTDEPNALVAAGQAAAEGMQ